MPVSVSNEPGLATSSMPPTVRHLLAQAMASYDDTPKAEGLLSRAYSLNPDQLDVYFAFYKFYFYKKRLPEAEYWARLGLQRAAEQGDFPAEWPDLTPDCADWTQPDGPERMYLYTLKALGFIRLRQLDFAGGEAILEKLHELDPQDQVGGSVIADVAAGLREALHDE